MSEFIAGVGLVAHLSTFLWCAFGAALGIVLGALPGLTPALDCFWPCTAALYAAHPYPPYF